jgi:hypothetical protein
MNRFRTKKRAKEAAEGIVRGSTDSDVPAMPTMKPSKTFRLGKKHQEPERKLELDLSNALPSSDDFRTSLLMSGLSARFSMLREQDDPKSKLGKASDDSVLFPSKRQSRLNDFGYQPRGLSDIAEVASINGSIRPPFAYSRTDSYNTTGSNGTDEDSNSGSIMNRSKPGEGNNLFGGRQKIYKIPVNTSVSTRSLADGAGSGMGGRALYENDVSQSAFQKLREREREQQREEHQEEDQFVRSGSPPLSGYNRNRETSSTTSSAGPSITRSSTAATSFTSQRTPSLSGSHTPITPNVSAPNTAIERTMTKGRRLYETGLDQHLHEQQFSAMNRIDTLTRQRTVGAQTPPPGLNSPTGLNQPADKWDVRHQIAGKASMPNMRAASPSPTVAAMGTFDFGVRPSNFPETKQAFGMPLSPPMSENDEHAVLAVQPNDRGKATALGAFTKPSQPYDENKYSQRQLQMQQGRETPPLRKHSPPRSYVPLNQQQINMRNRADSNATFASARSRSTSSAQRHFLPTERIQEMIPPPEITAPEERSIRSGTFLASPNDDSFDSTEDVEQNAQTRSTTQPRDLSSLYRRDQNIPLERPPESQHPAHRQRPFEAQASPPAIGSSPAIPAFNFQPSLDELPKTPVDTAVEPTDSPTLGPNAELSGLSGMVRQHLRSDSNTSSVYGGTWGGAPSAGLVSRFPEDHNEPLPNHNYSSKTNPWEVNDWDHEYDRENKRRSDASERSTKIDSAMPPPLAVRSPNVDGAEQYTHKSSWERELDTHHTRDGSTETQKERLDFKNDLAARRRRVQENLKSFVETEKTDSRSASPLPGAEWSRNVIDKTNALGLLKTKSSRGSLVVKSTEAKAKKMLGIGNATISSSPSPAKSDFDEIAWKQEEEEMLRGIPTVSSMTPPTKAFRQARRDAQRDRERQLAHRHQQRNEAEAKAAERSDRPIEGSPRKREPSNDRVPPNIRTRHRTPSRETKPPPIAFTHRNGAGQESQGSVATNRSGSRPASRTSRDRSSSDASMRSKSRNGRYKDDLARAMAEGTSSSSMGVYEDYEPASARLMPKSPGTPAMGFQPSPIPSPMIPSPMIGSDTRARSRSNSRSTPAGYSESQTLQPLQTGEADIGLSPRPSPITPFAINPTPALPQPSPAGSGPNTPTMNGFQSQGRIPANRKRSVNKQDISEPRFISSTSRITTVNLPPGASLQNGIEAPPIPPVNPRRKTRAMFGFGKKEDFDDYAIPTATQSTEEMSTFSDDGESKPKLRQKLRKSSSEGGNMNARARQAAFRDQSPAMPAQATLAPNSAMPGAFPNGNSSPPRPFEGNMF